MVFTENEHHYLRSQSLARLATIGPSGGPHVYPVAYRVTTEAIEIGGPGLEDSQKLRNVARDPRVSVVVDDVAEEAVGPGGQRGRGIEIRGRVEIVRSATPLIEGFSPGHLRVHPRRIVVWNVGQPGHHARTLS